MLYQYKRFEEGPEGAAASGSSFSIHDTDPRLDDAGGTPGAADEAPISDDKVLNWLQDRSQGRVKSAEDFQALLTAPGVDEESKAYTELGRKVKETPFVNELVNYALQPGGQERIDQYIGVLRQTQDVDKLTDFDKIVLADHLKNGLDLETTRLALKEEYGIDGLGEDSELSDSQKARIKHRLALDGKAAAQELKAVAERSKFTPETRDAEAARAAQEQANQQRIASFKPLLDGVANFVPAIEKTISVPFADGTKVDIPLRYDLATIPERAKELRDIANDIINAVPFGYSQDVAPQVAQAVQETYIGRHWTEIATALASQIAGNAALAAARRYHEPARGRAPMQPTRETTLPNGAIQGQDSKGNAWAVSSVPFDDE